jgi:hypothetical protein
MRDVQAAAITAGPAARCHCACAARNLYAGMINRTAAESKYAPCMQRRMTACIEKLSKTFCKNAANFFRAEMQKELFWRFSIYPQTALATHPDPSVFSALPRHHLIQETAGNKCFPRCRYG